MTVTRLVKRLLLGALTLPGAAVPFSALARDRAVIFGCHRFSDSARGIIGHDPSLLEKILRYLRRHRYDIVALPALVERLMGHGPPPNRSVAFTIDDGYFDLASVATPLFARFDCPVTGFVATGFLDGELWFWWDKIEYVFEHTTRTGVEVSLAGQRLTYKCANQAEREHSQRDFTDRCKRVPEAAKQVAIIALAKSAEVELPSQPPLAYQPMSWGQLRWCETQGVTFGPHSVSHPILSQVSEAQSKHEIEHSWRRLCSEAKRPVRVFAYPNGGRGDFGVREIETVRAQGLAAAISLTPGYNTAASFTASQHAAFSLSRFNYPDSLAHVIQCVTGIERIKWFIRGQPSIA
jgi:peptidoglycan/xylan/chitin deacetylase (PgdA/CDA1 family)